MSNRPLIVHKDRKVYLVEKLDSKYKVEDELNVYATLVHTPRNVHTYCLDGYSLWSATLLGYKEDEIIKFLQNNSINILPQEISKYIKHTIRDFWTLELYVEENNFILEGKQKLIQRILDNEKIRGKKIRQKKDSSLAFDIKEYYNVRNTLLKENIFLIEKAIKFSHSSLRLNSDVILYRYQDEAVDRFINSRNKNISGRGVIIMPPGSGKTIVALKVIEVLEVNTLILVKKKEGYSTWINEIKEKTNLEESNVAFNDFHSEKSICICTYSYAAREIDKSDFKSSWGLVIYDDANSLPALNNSKTAFINSKYKLAMDSIIWRADHRESLIFKAIGPKVFNLTLRKLEHEYYQIKVKCHEVKLPFQPWEVEEEISLIHTVSKNINKINAYKKISNLHIGSQKIWLVTIEKCLKSSMNFLVSQYVMGIQIMR